MKVLITGASGLLGATLCYQWGKNQELEILGIYNTNEILPMGFDVFQLDLSDSERLSGLIEAFQPDWIVHCAAKTDPDWCEANSTLALEMNTQASVCLSSIALRKGVRVIYISTDAVFSGTLCWYTESDVAWPVNHYGQTKLMAERAFHIHKDIIVRGSFYGWNLPYQRRGLFQFFYDNLSYGKYVDGWRDIYFSPLSTLQISDVLLDMMRRGWASGIYHLGCLHGYSKRDFALKICRVFGFSPHVRGILYTHQLGQAQRPVNVTLDTTKMQSKFSFPLSLGDGLEGLMEFQKTDLPQFRSMVR